MTASSLLRYPDNGDQLENAAMLRNAIQFTTEQRAFSAYGLLNQPFEKLKERELSYLAVDAFSAEMTSTEDVLGWLFVLRDWKPDSAATSLFVLLDKVKVGVPPWDEEAAAKLLDELNPDGLRALLHIPTEGQMETGGFSDEIRAMVTTSIESNLDGLKRLVNLRQSEKRARVRAFNKLKHLLLAMPRESRGKHWVLVPELMSFDGKEIHLQTVQIEASQKNVELMASRAIVAQAVLNGLLGMILWTRFDEPYKTPEWAMKAFDLPGWFRDKTPEQEELAGRPTRE